jgi:hypothetical protein
MCRAVSDEGAVLKLELLVTVDWKMAILPCRLGLVLISGERVLCIRICILRRGRRSRKLPLGAQRLKLN